jgi:hypothetical protein
MKLGKKFKKWLEYNSPDVLAVFNVLTMALECMEKDSQCCIWENR